MSRTYKSPAMDISKLWITGHPGQRRRGPDLYAQRPPSIEGDAWAMAHRAGARLINMEFFPCEDAAGSCGSGFLTSRGG